MIGKNLKKNNPKIALNVLYAKNPDYVSNYNSKREEQVTLLLIPNKKGWQYIAVKKPSALLRGTTSKHSSDYCYLNYFHSFRTKSKLESHKKVCEIRNFCNVVIPSEDTKILEFNQYCKSDKAPFES